MYRIIIRFRNGHSFHVPGAYYQDTDEAERIARQYTEHTTGASYEIEEVSAAH